MFTHYYRIARHSLSRQRAPLLELLLARADAATAVADWRSEAFRLIAFPAAAMPGVGAAVLYADGGVAQGATVMMATPVHYLAEMSNVRLPADGILSLRRAEADALAADFNRIWHDAGIRLHCGRSGNLFCLADRPLIARTHDPEDALDRHIDACLPAGADAPRLRQLMSEIEMWLFEHAVNRTRAAQGGALVSGLWLWGAGAALASPPRADGFTAGDDPFFNALAGRDASGVLSGVVASAAVPGTQDWHEVESRWLERSIADLRAGRIARLELSAGNRCFGLSRAAARRFWRRRRSWWESFE